MQPFIELNHSYKIFGAGEHEVVANKDISFAIQPGELTIIVGPSGAGKSTLLNILGGMEPNTKGTVMIDGEMLSGANQHQLTTFRRNKIGFVFQFYNLIPNLTAIENVELASEIVTEALDPKKVLTDVGLGSRLTSFPADLSGGEQQRVAIARAMAKNPALLLCDEPTGALDYHTGKKVLKLIQDFTHQTGKNTIIVTHNAAIKPMADHVIEIADGQITSDELNAHPVPVDQIEW